MAKQERASTGGGAENVTAFGLKVLSAAHKRTLLGLRRSVTDLAQKYGIVREKAANLAPAVVKLYDGIKAEHSSFTIQDFARLFDSSVPTHARERDGKPGYQKHPMYYTLTYMRRLVTATSAAGQRRGGQQGVRDSATDALARTLATVLQAVDNNGAAKIWQIVQAEFGFGERVMTRLRKRVEETEPLFKVPARTEIKVGEPIHMEKIAPAEETDAMKQPGRRVTAA